MKNGFSLLEVLIAVVVMTLLLLGLYEALSGAVDAQRTSAATGQIEQDAVRALDQLTSELRNCVTADLVVGNVQGYDTLTLALNLGIDPSGNALKSASIQYTCRLDSAELGDAKDNDNDGLTDECVFIRTQGGVEQVVATGIKDDGFTVSSLSGGAVQVTLTFQTTDLKRRVLERTLTGTAMPRN